MAKIRYSEVFYSIQGEGKWVGTPSVFLRTFGCNLTCQGFGQPRDNHIPESEMPHMLMDLTNITSVEQLPVVEMGCDSSASWSMKYKHLSPFSTTDEMAKQVQATLPEGLMFDNDVHLVITGGEPLLGWQNSYIEMFKEPQFKHMRHMTFETNGTKKVSEKFANYLNTDTRNNNKGVEVTWMVSPKLSLTGEDQSVTIDPEALLTMNQVHNSHINLKFVIRDEIDIDEVVNALSLYAEAGVRVEDVFLMPEGATLEGQELTEKGVADLCMKYAFKFSPRLHINLFGNSWGT